MTINAVYRADAIGNDTFLSIDYLFKIFAASHLDVRVKDSNGVETELTYPTHYSVTGVGRSGGGAVVLAVVGGVWQNVDGTLKTGYSITILRVVPVLQGTDIRNQGGFHADVHEDAFDYMTMIMQQHEDEIARSMKLPASFNPASFDTELPAPVAGAAIGWNSTGNALVNLVSLGGVGVSAYIVTLLDDANDTAARATLIAAKSGANTDITSVYLNNTGLKVKDTDASHGLTLKPGSNITADRILTLTTGDADRTLTLTSDATIAGTNSGDQPNTRQLILSAVLDSSGRNAALSAGAALNFNVDASPTPMIMTFAGGFSVAGNVDLVTALAADASNQGALVANNTNYIYADYLTTTTVTWGNGLIPPQYGDAFDRTQAALLNFEGTNGATSTTDDIGNTWTLTSATISTTQFKFGTSSLRLGGAAHRAVCSNITTMGDGSWEISCWVRPDTGASAASQMIFNATNAGGFGIQLYIDATGHITTILSSNGTSNDITAGVSGATVMANATQYKVRLVFDALAGTYRVYMSNNGAAEVQECTVSSTARICAFAQFMIGSATIAMVGYVDAFRFIRAATVTGTQTPAAAAPAIGDHLITFFSIPDKKMYEATLASASPGVNPTLTARNRLYVAEADTGAGTVSAMRNYQIGGRYDSGPVSTPAGSTAYSFASNIGTNFGVRVKPYMQCVTSSTDGVVGDRITDLYTGNATDGGPVIGRARRNTALYGSGAGGFRCQPIAGGNDVLLTAANWKCGVTAERMW